MLAASVAVIGVGMGCLFSLGVFLAPIAASTGWSRGSISTVALVNWLGMGVGSFVWGALSDRIGTRAVAAAGGLLLGLALVVSSQVTALPVFLVTFGFGVGFAVGAFYAPLTSTATKWFTTRRGLAVSIVSAGIGLGTVVVAPLTRWLTNLADWRMAMLVLGDLAWLIVVPAALLVRNAPGEVGAVALGGAAPADPRAFSGRQVLASPQFWAVAVTHFACCAAHAGPIFHMVTNAMDHGVQAMAAATVLAVSGLASIVGRIVCGLVADRIGAKRTLLAGLAVQAAAVFLYLFVRDLGAFYGLALLFGFAYGGVMPLYAIVVREYFGERIMGTAYGAVFLVSTLGMGLGSFAGGLVHDAAGGYAWLFGGSFAIGGMAVILALTFRPPRPLRVAPAGLPSAAG